MTCRAAAHSTNASADGGSNRTTHRTTNGGPCYGTGACADCRFRRRSRARSSTRSQKQKGAHHEEREGRFHTLSRLLTTYQHSHGGVQKNATFFKIKKLRNLFLSWAMRFASGKTQDRSCQKPELYFSRTARCNLKIWRMPFSASAISVFSSPRLNVCSSPVACNSTNSPFEVITTFMSTAASLSSM